MYELINKPILSDCFEVFSKIQNDSVDLIVTDIPYDEVNMKSGGLRELDRGFADTLNFDLNSFLMECDRVCKGSVYIFCGIEQVSEIKKFFRLNGWSTRLGIYEKSNPSPMNGQHLWLSGLETCVYAKKPKAVFNEHCKKPIWKFPSGSRKRHPTEKNLKLFEYIISVSSNEGDLVLDPCAGSFTTAEACKNLNRNYICCDSDEQSYSVGLERLTDK